MLTVHTDVSKEAEVQALAEQTLERFGAVHVVCNNAGVAARSDPWFGPIASWEWVMGVNFWGVVHGCRAFLPHLAGGGHIVNTASIAGLMTGFAPSYDASKHAVVAISEDLFNTVKVAGLPIGVSVLCPGWVRTNIVEADRNWPAELGEKPADDPANAVFREHVTRALAEGRTPASVADAVADAIAADRFWVIPHQDFLDIAVARWETIAERADPEPRRAHARHAAALADDRRGDGGAGHGRAVVSSSRRALDLTAATGGTWTSTGRLDLALRTDR